MSQFALLNCTSWVHGYDFTGDTNKVALEASAEELDATVFGGGGWKKVVGGLKTVTGALEGYWQSGPDNESFGDLGTANRVVTMSVDGTATSTAYMFQATKLKYSAFGKVGDLTPFTLDMSGSNTAGMVRGQVAAPPTVVSATGAFGSVVQLGAVSSTQYVYASLHVLGTPGTTVTVKVESASNAGFTTGVADVQSFGAVTAAGGTWLLPKAGAIANTYYRFNATAITGSFTLAGSIGVR